VRRTGGCLLILISECSQKIDHLRTATCMSPAPRVLSSEPSASWLLTFENGASNIRAISQNLGSRLVRTKTAFLANHTPPSFTAPRVALGETTFSLRFGCNLMTDDALMCFYQRIGSRHLPSQKDSSLNVSTASSPGVPRSRSMPCCPCRRGAGRLGGRIRSRVLYHFGVEEEAEKVDRIIAWPIAEALGVEEGQMEKGCEAFQHNNPSSTLIRR
jgi:hypothetical protein